MICLGAEGGGSVELRFEAHFFKLVRIIFFGGHYDN